MPLDFSFEYLLENDRALLRPLQQNDIEHLEIFALSEPTLWKFSAISAAGTEGMKSYIETALQGRKRLAEYPFIVFDKQVGRYAGCTRFYDVQNNNNTLQLGYTWYGKDFQGTGLNKNCKLLLLTLAFDTLGFNRVEFRADNTNATSIAAMKSIGCVVEGVLRSNMPRSSGGRRDSIVLSILKTEWNNGGREMLEKKIAALGLSKGGI